LYRILALHTAPTAIDGEQISIHELWWYCSSANVT
jgi:hypothetical protein